MSLTAWSWTFLVGYVGLMVGIGVYAKQRIKHADDFATARGAYGPVFLALAFAASTASSTFPMRARCGVSSSAWPKAGWAAAPSSRR